MNKSLIIDMCEAARSACHSGYKSEISLSVGAAVIGDDYEIYTGYFLKGSTHCTTFHAEIAAIINALTNGSNGIMCLALYLSEQHKDRTPIPCGACLQAISDFACDDDVDIYISNPLLYPSWTKESLSGLLPNRWGK